MPKAQAAQAAPPTLPPLIQGLPEDTILPTDPALPPGLFLAEPMRGVRLPDGRALPLDLPVPTLSFHFPDLYPPDALTPRFDPEPDAPSPEPAPSEVTNAEQ